MGKGQSQAPMVLWPSKGKIHLQGRRGGGGGGGWHKALVVGSVGLWRRLLASRL